MLNDDTFKMTAGCSISSASLAGCPLMKPRSLIARHNSYFFTLMVIPLAGRMLNFDFSGRILRRFVLKKSWFMPFSPMS